MSSLDKVENKIIRRATAVLLAPLAFLACFFVGVFLLIFSALDCALEFFLECWFGFGCENEENEHD